MVTIRRIHLSKLSLRGGNYICMNGHDIVNSKIDVAESELMRILRHIENPDIKSVYGKKQYSLDSIISLKVGKNVKKYRKLMGRNGKLTIVYVDADGHVIDVATYVSQITGAGHSRSQKSFFIRTDVVSKVDEILRCGISQYKEYAKPSKWNAYYGMVATDSVAVTLPNIVVIDNFKKMIREQCDIVQEYGPQKYRVRNDELTDIEMTPFDGEGLVTPDMARKWAEEIGCNYLPSGFQFRAIPGVKGMLFTFDFKQFAEEYDVSTIRDIWGDEWNVFDDEIDCVMTKSQFKFYDQYKSYREWLNCFKTKIGGYQRTFNISDIAEGVNSIKRNMMISYQPLQTISFTDKEIEAVCESTIQTYTSFCTDPNEFIRFRGLRDCSLSKSGDELPPYYTALSHDQLLFADPYIRSKVFNDLSGLKNRILSGKIYVRGNYQILAVDLFALCQYAFGLPPTGLLKKGEVYSLFWNQKLDAGRDAMVIDVIRNPHINHEHRLCQLANNEETKKWYRYQTTGIIANIYDSLLLALNGADCDGDHVGTVYDPNIIAAVEREKLSGNARTVVFEPYVSGTSKNSLRVDDVRGLMEVNLRSFENSIGDVINAITKLWNCNLTPEIRDSIKIMSVIGALTIDFAKTGQAVEIPTEIKMYLRSIKKPYHLRYQPKNKRLDDEEKRSLKNARDFQLDISKDTLKFGDAPSNVNRLCHYLEERLADAEFIQPKEEFEFTMLLSSIPSIKREFRSLAVRLQGMYHKFSTEYNMIMAKSESGKRDCKNHYSFFYRYCRDCFIDAAGNIDTALDMLLILYYTDKWFIGKSKDIMWNAFGTELTKRCQGNFSSSIVDINRIQERKKKKNEIFCKEKKRRENAKCVAIKSIIPLETFFNVEDKLCIMRQIQKRNQLPDGRELTTKDTVTVRRLLAILLILQRMHGGSLTLYSNRMDDLTVSTIARLIAIDHRKITTAMRWLKALGALDISEDSMKNIRLSVKVEDHIGTDIYRGSDYNEAAKVVKRSFR